MANVVIPFFDAPSFREEITLEGTPYVFQFSWNYAGSFWSLSIFDRDSNPLVLGIRLVLNYEHIKRHPIIGMPPGELYVIDINEGSSDIAYEDLTSNGRCQVVYVESV